MGVNVCVDVRCLTCLDCAETRRNLRGQGCLDPSGLPNGTHGYIHQHVNCCSQPPWVHRETPRLLRRPVKWRNMRSILSVPVVCMLCSCFMHAFLEQLSDGYQTSHRITNWALRCIPQAWTVCAWSSQRWSIARSGQVTLPAVAGHIPCALCNRADFEDSGREHAVKESIAAKLSTQLKAGQVRADSIV
jgi:hypothetical protein